MTIATSHTLLGAFIGGPYVADAAYNATVNQQYNGFVSTMGQTPSLMDTFVDFNQPESEWAGNAQWAADQWKGNGWQGIIPSIAIPMASQGENADQSFKNIANGSEDAVFNGIFQAWANDGYTQMYIRPGWEMNGDWFQWSVTADNASDYVAAFQHIAGLAHAFSGASIQVVWNPNVGNSPVPMSQLYPGNTAADIIGLDTYGAPINYDGSPNDTSTSSSDFTLTDALAMAKANGKPFALPETGGANASFPTALASVIAQSGVQVGFVNIWDLNNYQGNLSFSNPGDNQATAAAWKAAFQTIANASNALSGSTTSPPPPPATHGPASANDTVVMAGSTAAITDASGNSWTITSGGQVAINGTVDPVTANVTELAYVNGTIWQENTDKMWWGETKPNSWQPTAGTATSPLPTTTSPPPVTQSANDTVVMAGTTAAITDASGNKWTITSGGQVATNGTVDPITANVVELAYVNGTIWQENTDKMWWGETKPNSWQPTAGTATSPLPTTTSPPPVTQSANDTVVMAGTTAAITDASGNKWTITSGGQVATNGTVDPITSNVTELAYVNGTIWQENTDKMWWGETKPNSWQPTAGTATSPLPTAPPASSTLKLNMSEDAYLGDAQFTVAVDGTQVGGTMTASVSHASGDANVFVLTGTWAATAAHQVAINFINDAYGGSTALDRNLYVNSIAFNGTTEAGTAATMNSSGSHTFAVGGTTAAAAAPADTITLNLSEDAYQGNAQFSLSIDGKQVTTPQAVTASHSAAAWQAFSFSGNLGAGSHTVGITFGNDAYGGSASLDRNLYANGIDVNGQHYGTGVSALMSNSTVNFAIVTTH